MGNQNAQKREETLYTYVDRAGDVGSTLLPDQAKDEIDRQIQELKERLTDVANLVESEVK